MSRIMKVRHVQQDPDTWQLWSAGVLTTAGGNAAETFKVRGMNVNDIVLVTLHTQGSGSRTLTKAVPVKNGFTVTFSGDPSSDHKISYAVYRYRGGVSAKRRVY